MQDFATRRIMMVDSQVRPSDVTKFPIIEAMLSIPREAYVPSTRREAAYVGENLELAPGRVMLEPRTLSKMLDVLDIMPSDLVLDVGCGHGYSSAVIAWMAEAVVALEEEELAAQAEATLAAEGNDNVAVVTGKLVEGAAQHGPYDAIIIQGAVEVVPDALLEQLKEGGRIACVFMETALGVVRIGHKIDGQVVWRDVFNAAAPVLPGFAAKRVFVL